jgi:hypothetical protein
MKITPLIAVLFLAAACGGPSQDNFNQATPSFESMSMDVTAADATPDDGPGTTTSDPSIAIVPPADLCHPHLFARTHAIVQATNGGIWRVLSRIHFLIHGFGPTRRDGGTHVWERVVNGIDFKYSIIKTGDHSFTAELDVKKETDPDTAFVAVYTASVERDPSNHDGSGSAMLDLDKLAAVTGDKDSGQVALQFTVTPTDKTVISTITNFSINGGVPRNGHYVFFNQPGKGGSLKFQDDLFLACTGDATTMTKTTRTPVEVVARWIDLTDSIHFRADALATGGQVPTGDKWEGITCAEGGAPARKMDAGMDAGVQPSQPRETYWMMKLEAADGSTISAHSAQNTVATAAACDPVFGAVPSIDNSSTDYDFSKVDFVSNDPLPFP